MTHRLTCGVLALALATTCCQASRATVRDTTGLLRALRNASPGATIQLEPGVYSGVVIRDFHGSATITSADRSHPATVTDFIIQDSSGLTVRDLDLSTENDPVGPNGVNNTIPFVVTRSSRIVLTRLQIHGAANGSLQTDISGMMVRDSNHVEVSDSDFHHLHNGLTHFYDTDLTVRGNHFHLLRDDGMRGGGSSNVLVEGNHCDSQHPDAADADHPDCIQFWTSNIKTASHDITITGNTYERGAGGPAQGIFLRDETGHLPYEHVTITGNTISGALWGGISVFGAKDVTVTGNVVCPYPGQESWILMRVVDGAKLSDNQAMKFQYLKSSGIVDQHNDLPRRCARP